MSWRQPRAASSETVPARTAAPVLVFNVRLLILMLHLYHGDRGELLEKRPRPRGRKLGIGRLQAEEKSVRRRAVAEVRRIEQRVVELRHSIQRNHPKRRRQAGE